MTKLKRTLLVAAVLVAILAAVAVFQIYHYPQAQVASATHAAAADFTLPDAQGNPFRLSAQRGHKVVLYFYRGYW